MLCLPVGCEGRLWATWSRTAAELSVHTAAGPVGRLSFLLPLLLPRSHWKSQRAYEPHCQYAVSESVCLSRPHPPSALALTEWLGFLPFLQQLGIQALCRQRLLLKPLPDVLFEKAEQVGWLGQTSSLSVLLQSACETLSKTGLFWRKDANPGKSKCLENEFIP